MTLNDPILIFVLGFLMLTVTFNLWLTFRLIRSVRLLPMSKHVVAQKLTEGILISDFDLDRITDKKSLTLYEFPDHAKVLVFLTSKCKKCKSKLPELHESLEIANRLGVMIWILTLETKGRMKNFLQNDNLMDVSMRVSQSSYDYLNPEGASPYYLFIDAENTLQAQGFIGDENWVGFLKQLEQGH